MGLLDPLRNLLGGGDGAARADAGEAGAAGTDAGETGVAGTAAGDDDAEQAYADAAGTAGTDVGEDGAAGDAEFAPADFRERAADLAGRYEEEDLDFTVASLVRLDDVAAGQGEILGLLDEEMDDGDDLVSTMRGGYTLDFGSYLGEVLVRAFDGEWAHDGDGWGVAVPVGGGSLSVAVFDVAARSVADEPIFAEVVANLEGAIEDTAETTATDAGADPALAGEADPEMVAGADSEMAAEARDLASYWPGYDLDFSPASLARLDALVDEQWDERRFRATTLDGDDMDSRVFAGLVTQLGSYYGEVLVRNLDAEWTQHEDFGTAVEVSGPGDAAAVANVFHVAEDCLTEPSKFALNYDTIADQLDLDVPSVHEGGGEVLTINPGDLDAAVADVDLDDVIEGFQEDAADLVGKWPGYDLDYSPASLERLDRLVAEEFADYDLSDVELGDETDGDSLFLTAHAMEAGGYLAEVLRRHLGGEWREDDGPTFVVEGRDGAAHLDPVAVAADCFRGEDSFAATYEAVRGRLSVPEREDRERAAEGGGKVDAAAEGGIAEGVAEGEDEEADAIADGEAVEGDERTDTATDEDVTEQEKRPGASVEGTVAEQYRAGAERLAEAWPAYGLDASVESLARLDALVAEEFDLPTDGGVPETIPTAAELGLPPEASPDRFVGYVAAVFTHNHDAAWHEGPVLVVEGASGTAELDPAVLAAPLQGAATFVRTYAQVAAAIGLDPPIDV